MAADYRNEAIFLPLPDAIFFLLQKSECTRHLHESTTVLFNRRLYADESTVALL